MLFNSLDLCCDNYYHTLFVVVLAWFWIIYSIDKLIQIYNKFMSGMQMQLPIYKRVLLNNKILPTICIFKERKQNNSIGKIDWGLNTPFMQNVITIGNLSILIIVVSFFFFVKPLVFMFFSLYITLKYLLTFLLVICCCTGLHCGSILSILTKQGLGLRRILFSINSWDKVQPAKLQSTGRAASSAASAA